MAVPPMPEVQEVTLADIVRVLWRRKLVLLSLFLLTVGGGIAYTVLKAPEYSSQATLVAIEQQDVIQRWLESRSAAEFVAQNLGDPLLSQLFPKEWSKAAGAWNGAPPGLTVAGLAVTKLVTVTVAPPVSGRVDRTMRIAVVFTDANLARDVANAYVTSLDEIRPTLQNVTESVLFQQFYTGQNPQDARRQAHEVALERQYWIALDPAYAATAPSSPNVNLNIALSLVLGVMLGVVGAFMAEWVANYRVSSRPPVVPEAPKTTDSGGAFRYRGK